MSSAIETFGNELQEADPSRTLEAAQKLLDSGEGLLGPPPPEFVAILMASDAGIEPPLLNLAAAWSRTEMSRAMFDALDASELDDREQAAWLLKTVLAVEHSAEATKRVQDGSENPQVRRWLIEGLERLALGGEIGWAELESVLRGLADSDAPTLKAGLSGLLSVLPWREESAAMLRSMLEDDHPEVISAAAHVLARHPDAVRDLQPGSLERLQRNPNPIVRAGARTLIEAIHQD